MKNVKPHYIRHNKGRRLPSILVFYDTESEIRRDNSREIHVFKLLTYRVYERDLKHYVLRSENTVFNPRDFYIHIDKLANKQKLVWIIAHNQHYDFFVSRALDILKELGYKLVNFAFESDIFFARFSKEGKKRLLFVDSMNYFKTSIAEMGKLIGKEKLSVDFEHTILDELIKYNKRDVEILSEFFIKFLEWWTQNDLGNFGLSVAQLAINAYRHKFMSSKILVHNNPRALELERLGYYGGRTECFYIGEVKGEKLYKLDVNSMYPYHMAIHKFPYKLLGLVENPSIKYIRRIVREYSVIAEVEINTEEPVFPLRLHKLIFPRGQFTTVLSTPEVLYALENNYLVKVNKLAVYKQDYLFTSYVRYFYNLKRRYEGEGNKIMRTFAKLLLNSLYGKFAQCIHPYEPIDYPVREPWGHEIYVDANTGEKRKILFIDGRAYTRNKQGIQAHHTLVAISTHITAYARIDLYNLMKKAGLDNVYYVDTDSLIVNQRGLENLQDRIGDELGQLKIEKESDYALFLAPKVYVFGTERKFKGLTQRAKQISPKEYEDIRFWRALTLLSKGIHDHVIVEKYIKHFRLIYDKGKITETGRVKPWKLPEDYPEIEKLKSTKP